MQHFGARELLDFSCRLQWASTLAELVTEAQREIRARIGYNNAWLFVWEDETLETGRLIAIQGDKQADVWEHAPVLHTRDDQMLQEIVRGQGAVVVADARTDPRTDKRIVEALGNRTIVNVVLRLLDKPLGSLGCGTFGDEGCRPPSPEEIDYLVQIASHVSVAAGRIRLAQEERAREEQRAALEQRLREYEPFVRFGVAAGDAAHELELLLASIREVSAALVREPSIESQRRGLERLVTASERATELVRELEAKRPKVDASEPDSGPAGTPPVANARR